MKAAGAAVKRGRPFDRKRSWSISAGRLVTIWGKRKPHGCVPIRAGTNSYFAVMVVGLPSSPTKTTRTLAGTLPLLKSWCW